MAIIGYLRKDWVDKKCKLAAAAAGAAREMLTKHAKLSSLLWARVVAIAYNENELATEKSMHRIELK